MVGLINPTGIQLLSSKQNSYASPASHGTSEDGPEPGPGAWAHMCHADCNSAVKAQARGPKQSKSHFAGSPVHQVAVR